MLSRSWTASHGHLIVSDVGTDVSALVGFIRGLRVNERHSCTPSLFIAGFEITPAYQADANASSGVDDLLIKINALLEFGLRVAVLPYVAKG
jgi:hypothetical protein